MQAVQQYWQAEFSCRCYNTVTCQGTVRNWKSTAIWWEKILETIYSTFFVFIRWIFFKPYLSCLYCCNLMCICLSHLYLLYLMCICCTFMCICCIYVYLLYSYVYLLYLMCICCILCVFVVLLCVFVVFMCICCTVMCICCTMCVLIFFRWRTAG